VCCVGKEWLKMPVTASIFIEEPSSTIKSALGGRILKRGFLPVHRYTINQ
jgi:hypothetical protein